MLKFITLRCANPNGDEPGSIVLINPEFISSIEVVPVEQPGKNFARSIVRISGSSVHYKVVAEYREVLEQIVSMYSKSKQRHHSDEP